MADHTGTFITFEGGEGSGKTTQINRVASHLTDQGHQVITTREPGGTDQANAIRSLLVQRSSGDWPPFAELCLVTAARMVHMRDIIAPALNEGKIVLCDRFIHSTIAYQGYGRGVDRNTIDAMITHSIGALNPDLTFYLDIDVTEGIARTKRRESAESFDGDVLEDKFESLDLSFHENVRKGFLSFANDDTFVTVDAAQDIDTVTDAILNTLNKTIVT